ncbi:MAG: DUF6677 family protein [Phycisphaerae bacterium]
MKQKVDPVLLTTQAGMLAWLIPGAGHFMLGMRGFAIVYFIAVTFCYFGGMLIGGIKGSVDPKGNPWLFAAELGVGGYTGAMYLIAQSIPTFPPKDPSPYISYYPESDVAQIYISVAGLLNILAVLDAMTRAQTGGLPVFHFELNAQRARLEAQAAERKAAAERAAASDPSVPVAPASVPGNESGAQA